MRFTTNLATKIYIDTKKLRVYTAAALLLLFMILFFNVRSLLAKADELSRLKNEIAAFDERSKTARKDISEKDYQALLKRISFANSIIDKKTYNWLALLDSFEALVPEGVAISSIEPDTKNQALKFSGVALSFKNIRTFMERLEDSKTFKELYLANQATIKLDDKRQAITFTLTSKMVKK